MTRAWGLDTAIIHAGEPRPRIGGAITPPIFQSSTFEYAGEGSYHDVRYMRASNTPNHLLLHAKLAALEGGEAALVTASGMAAISAALLSTLSAGDHLLVHRTLYGGTRQLVVNELPSLGIEHTAVDADDPSSWARALRPRTRAFYVETMTNPTLEVVDLDAVAAFSEKHGLASIIDNTFATPVNFTPIARGFDVVVHSASKYLNGHSDIVAGVVVGSDARVERAKHKLDHLGGALDAHACFLLHRGLRTLALRVRHQNESALRLARFLEGRPEVARVDYPGLESHRRHARARELFRGMGGLVSFEIGGGLPSAERFCSRLRLAAVAPSLGGPETLVTLPSTTSHAGVPAEERRASGITDGLIRVSVGLESVDDLADEFEQALRG